mmetsp:Transcript_63360/g.72606  ORF Transcript_63360/g.72606 Transcript_63360/m.72606 type:complete len:295 (+) Transcript_63360:43-927(+)
METSLSPKEKKRVLSKSQSTSQMKKLSSVTGFGDTQHLRTSFGKLPLAHEKSSPSFGFGTSGRFDHGKQHLGTENVTHLIGNNSPGPAYGFSDTWKYKTNSSVKFGSAKRQDLMSGPVYDYYSNGQTYDSPEKASEFCRPKPRGIKFGTTRRMRLETVDCSPGPVYNYEDNTLRKSVPNFSLGVRRENGDSPLKLATSTTNLVGPGRYSPEVDRTRNASPKFSLTKCPRIPKTRLGDDQNQTYVDYSSFGKQSASVKRSSGAVTFGMGKKHDNRGHFRNMMVTFSESVRLPHVN